MVVPGAAVRVVAESAGTPAADRASGEGHRVRDCSGHDGCQFGWETWSGSGYGPAPGRRLLAPGRESTWDGTIVERHLWEC